MNKTIQELFKQWLKETNRSGGVLLGSSVREFFDWLELNNYKIEKNVGTTN